MTHTLMTHKLVTANRLGDGEVVYLTATGAWSEDLQDAVASNDPADHDAQLECGMQAERDLKVVGPYLMVVDRDADGAWRPVSQRETIRAHGPSVRRDLGKQAQASLAAASLTGADHVSL